LRRIEGKIECEIHPKRLGERERQGERARESDRARERDIETDRKSEALPLQLMFILYRNLLLDFNFNEWKLHSDVVYVHRPLHSLCDNKGLIKINVSLLLFPGFGLEPNDHW